MDDLHAQLQAESEKLRSFIEGQFSKQTALLHDMMKSSMQSSAGGARIPTAGTGKTSDAITSLQLPLPEMETAKGAIQHVLHESTRAGTWPLGA
ncbi:unnamed protein product [Symbiodinium sp. CCMP2592]|nr:unnamed protein product [Symbiodinium sp. CCMP2592]